MNDIFPQMGIVKIFTDEAELKNILERQFCTKVSKIIHKTVVELSDEELPPPPPSDIASTSQPEMKPHEEKKFVVDHPFLFFVKTENFVLFSGRVSSM